MRSAASFKGHPIHVMLIPFPLAFLVGAFVAELGAIIAWHGLAFTAGVLALSGIATAVVAALPGAIDYFRTVPPESTARTRATRHALVNLGAVALFLAGLLLRGGVDGEPALASLAAWGVGVGLLTMGGWMGGTLVYRNQIGVDHRYARAGKWSEVRPSGSPSPVVARVGDLEPDQMRLVHLDGRRIVLARTDDGFVAFDDRCPHSGGSLAGGSMMCGTVQCPWHGSQFDVRDGSLRAGPADTGIRTHPVQVTDGEIRILF